MGGRDDNSLLFILLLRSYFEILLIFQLFTFTHSAMYFVFSLSSLTQTIRIADTKINHWNFLVALFFLFLSLV